MTPVPKVQWIELPNFGLDLTNTNAAHSVVLLLCLLSVFAPQASIRHVKDLTSQILRSCGSATEDQLRLYVCRSPRNIRYLSRIMLQISKNQLAAFEDAALDSFILETATHVRHVMPERVAQFDDRALLHSLRKRLEQALAYGITDRFDALRYLECSYMLNWTDGGPDEAARTILVQTELKAEERMDTIERRTDSI